MKLFLSLAFGVSLIAFNSTETVPRHNVFFAYNSSELSGSPARVVESVYAKVAAGHQIRFGITGPISNVHSTSEKNRITAARAKSIIDLLKRISNEKDVFEVRDVSNPYRPIEMDLSSNRPFELEVLLTKAPGWIEPSFTSIDEFLPLPIQTFTIDPRIDNRLVGDKGTVINIPAFTLALGNNSVPATMTVELKEVYGSGTIVNADLHTNSGGKMLQTGGTIHIDAHSNGSKAKVASGETIDLEFPNPSAEPEPDMEVFNGRVDRAGNFDWVPKKNNRTITESRSREEFYINDVQVSKEEYYRRMQEWADRKAAYEKEKKEREEAEKNFQASQANNEALDAYLLSSDQLGWINCDKFYDVPEKTDVIVMVDTSLRPSVRMVFDNIASVMNGHYEPRTQSVTFSGIPVGEPVRLVGYSIKDGVAFMANQAIKTSKGFKTDLPLKQTSKEQMQAELASLN